VPERVLRAMDKPTIDHRGPQFQTLAKRIFEGLPGIFRTAGPVIVFPASGTGTGRSAPTSTRCTWKPSRR
jgi:alanine-glyoxylate transaminase/serine-glyoxylate transaminase/serine-pyruvate transaminase